MPTIDTSDGTFTSVYKCIYNVWTNGNGEIISGRVTDSAGSPVAGAVIAAVRSGGVTNTTTSNARGIYAFLRVPSLTTNTISATKAGYVFTSRTVTAGLSSDYSATAGNIWAVDFAQSDSNNPTGFSATSVGSSRIDLSWGKNPSGDNVMVAWNSSPAFGVPSGTYSIGNAIAGGGTVLYSGSATNFSHTGLTSGNTYFYKAWSVHNGTSYSSGLTASATTTHDFVFTENFEHGGAMPSGWTQQYTAGALNWTFQNGGYEGCPYSAHGGSYNAFLFIEDYSDYRTKLVTQPINFGSATRNAQLTFWLCMENWYGDQDQLSVFYKTSAGSPWNLLATYSTEAASWTQQTLSLPNPGGTYYIAFEGDANFGYGVCIDDVAITADNPLPPCFSITLSGTNLIMNCTNGPASGTYYVLASTNLAIPSTNWPVIATNSFDVSGCSRFTNAPGNNLPKRYFRIRLP